MFCFLFVDLNAPLKLAGEYYVKSFVKTICAIMCIKGVFALHVFGLFCSQDEGEKEKKRGQQWWQWPYVTRKSTGQGKWQ